MDRSIREGVNLNLKTNFCPVGRSESLSFDVVSVSKYKEICPSPSLFLSRLGSRVLHESSGVVDRVWVREVLSQV